jgi:hypothetical protein
MMDPETITISKKAYEELVQRDFWLAALEEAGVDNWDGFDEARDILRRIKEEAAATA